LLYIAFLLLNISIVIYKVVKPYQAILLHRILVARFWLLTDIYTVLGSVFITCDYSLSERRRPIERNSFIYKSRINIYKGLYQDHLILLSTGDTLDANYLPDEYLLRRFLILVTASLT
jgi:hypothetical protein